MTCLRAIALLANAPPANGTLLLVPVPAFQVTAIFGSSLEVMVSVHGEDPNVSGVLCSGWSAVRGASAFTTQGMALCQCAA